VREKIITFIKLFFACCVLHWVILFFGGCATGRGTGAVVSDLGNGTAEYRAIQGEIRSGETELAITGTKIEAGLGELERSISGSQGAEQEIRDIIQQVRARPVDPDLIEEWKNRQTEGRSGNGETEDNKS